MDTGGQQVMKTTKLMWKIFSVLLFFFQRLYWGRRVNGGTSSYRTRTQWKRLSLGLKIAKCLSTKLPSMASPRKRVYVLVRSSYPLLLLALPCHNRSTYHWLSPSSRVAVNRFLFHSAGTFPTAKPGNLTWRVRRAENGWEVYEVVTRGRRGVRGTGFLRDSTHLVGR